MLDAGLTRKNGKFLAFFTESPSRPLVHHLLLALGQFLLACTPTGILRLGLTPARVQQWPRLSFVTLLSHPTDHIQELPPEPAVDNTAALPSLPFNFVAGNATNYRPNNFNPQPLNMCWPVQTTAILKLLLKSYSA